MQFAYNKHFVAPSGCESWLGCLSLGCAALRALTQGYQCSTLLGSFTIDYQVVAEKIMFVSSLASKLAAIFKNHLT